MFKALSKCGFQAPSQKLLKKLTLLSLFVGASAIVSTSANASLIVTQSDVVLTGEEGSTSQKIDLNGDGYDDIEFTLINGYVFGEVPAEIAGVNGIFNEVVTEDGFMTTQTRFLDNPFSGELLSFAVGESVGYGSQPVPVFPVELILEDEYAYDEDAYNDYLISEDSYLSEEDGLLDFSTVDSGILYQNTDGDFGFPPFLIPELGDSAIFGYQFTTTSEETGTDNFFGFVEVTHGSIIVGSVGFQTTPGVAAVVTTAVNAPVTISLFMLAIGGLFIRRRLVK
jgi:hypothetical protein